MVFAGFVAGTALAGHWLNGDAYKAGDKNVYFHQCDMADNTHEAFHDNNGHDIAPTAIDPSTPHGCSVTDVQIHDDSHQNSSWYGLYRCFDFHSPNVCDKAYIHINTKFQQIPEKYLFTLGIVCEEVGHSVGLGHRGSEGTCMKDPTRALDRDHLDGHDKDAINNNY